MSKPTPADIFFIALQLGLILIYFIEPPFIADSLAGVLEIIGAIPMLIGGLLVLWGFIQLLPSFSFFPTPARNARLITNGIFSYIRHPIYSGLIMLAVGFSIYDANFFKVLLSFALIIFWQIKAAYEEKQLLDRFPEYANYKAHTGRFMPTFLRFRIKRNKPDEASVPPKQIAAESRDDRPSEDSTEYRDS